jgi:hypothetical protein
MMAKVAACVGLLVLVTAPLLEGTAISGRSSVATKEPEEGSRIASVLDRLRSGPTAARAWSVWGFGLSSLLVWVLLPPAVLSARLDGLRGALGMIGWALFAFASAGPVLRSDTTRAARVVANTALKPRNELRRGDGVYVALGVGLALSMQSVGWGIAIPERAVLVRLVTVVCGMALLGATASIALARHSTRTAPLRGLRRALPWLVMLAVVGIAGLVVGMAH